jgi:hypothetical protein
MDFCCQESAMEFMKNLIHSRCSVWVHPDVYAKELQCEKETIEEVLKWAQNCKVLKCAQCIGEGTH